MSGKNNLIPIRSTEEAREKGKNGGKKSGEARRQKKKMKEQMELLLSLRCKDKKTVDFINNLGVEGEIDNQMALLTMLYGRALKGNIAALQEIRKITQDDKTTSTNERVQIINDLPGDVDES